MPLRVLCGEHREPSPQTSTYRPQVEYLWRGFKLNRLQDATLQLWPVASLGMGPQFVTVPFATPLYFRSHQVEKKRENEEKEGERGEKNI